MNGTTPVYLRTTTKIEPAVCRWPAWPHLIAPAQHALNLTYRQLPSLRNFVTSPVVHVTAAKDPAMVGGPFVCLLESDIPAVRALIAETERTCAHLIEFAHALRAFNKHIQALATGLSLDELYDKVPRSLAGLLE